MKAGRLLGTLAVIALWTTGCGEGTFEMDYPMVRPDNLQTIASELRPEARKERATLIKSAAAQKGLTNAVLLAGIADAETNFAHCWSEARWACQGPASSSCGGGPVIAGSADGPCSARQGGLGMFQFDAGTYDQTLAREGRRILTVEGNTQAAVDFIVHRVKISEFIPGVDTEAQALEWMNNVRPGTQQWDQWIRTVTGYYNGCFQGRCRVFHERYNNYDSKTRNILNEMGQDFWFGAAGTVGAASNTPPATNTPPDGSSNTGTTAPAGRPSVAHDLAPANASIPVNSSINLSWNSVDATRYTIRMEYFADGNWRHYFEWTRNTTVFEVWPQAPNTSYRWTVQACNANGCADWAPFAMFDYGQGAGAAANTDPANGGVTDPGTTNTDTTDTTDTSGGTSTAPPAPTDGTPGMPASMSPAGVRVDTAGVTLSWSEPLNAQSYDIIMYYHDGLDWRDYYVWEGKRGGSFTVWPVIDEAYYVWAIRACNALGCSDWSDFQQFYFGGG